MAVLEQPQQLQTRQRAGQRRSGRPATTAAEKLVAGPPHCSWQLKGLAAGCRQELQARGGTSSGSSSRGSGIHIPQHCAVCYGWLAVHPPPTHTPLHRLRLPPHAGRSKGWGIVEFETPEEALAAINTLNGVELGGRTILVREDREDRDVKQVGVYTLCVLILLLAAGLGLVVRSP